MLNSVGFHKNIKIFITSVTEGSLWVHVVDDGVHFDNISLKESYHSI